MADASSSKAVHRSTGLSRRVVETFSVIIWMLQISDFKLQISGFRLLPADYADVRGFMLAAYPLPATRYPLPLSDCCPQITQIYADLSTSPPWEGLGEAPLSPFIYPFPSPLSPKPSAKLQKIYGNEVRRQAGSVKIICKPISRLSVFAYPAFRETGLAPSRLRHSRNSVSTRQNFRSNAAEIS